MTPEKTATIIKYASVILILCGIVFALPAFRPISGPGILMIDMLDWPIDGGSAAISAEARWFAGVGGGLVVGMGMMFITIVVPLLRAGNTLVRTGAIQSLAAWYILDSGASIAAGFASNAFFNSIFLAMLLVPLVMMRSVDLTQKQMA